jgi:hypothetical protein
VTRRIWILLAVGVVTAAAIGVGFSRAGRPAFTASKPSASWGVFTPAQWQTVRRNVQRRGFDAATVRVVGTTSSRRPFALVAATSSTGATCVTPVNGTMLGTTICRLSKPLVVFSAPVTWRDAAVPGTPAHTVHATSLLGIVRRDVSGVVAIDHLGRMQGIALMPAGRMGTFAAGFADATSLRAYDARDRVLARIVLPPR